MESLLFEEMPEGVFAHPIRREIEIPTYIDEILSKTLPTYEHLRDNFHTYTDAFDHLPANVSEMSADKWKETIDKLLKEIPITHRIVVTCTDVNIEGYILNLTFETTCPRVGGNYEAFKNRLSYPCSHQIQVKSSMELKEQLKKLYISAVLCVPISVLQALAIREHHKHSKAAYATKCASIFLAQSDTTHAEIGYDHDQTQDWLTTLNMSIEDLCEIYTHSYEDIFAFAIDLILPVKILHFHELSPLTRKFDVVGLFEKWQRNGKSFSDIKLAVLTGDEYDQIEVFTAHLPLAIQYDEGLCVVHKNSGERYLVIDCSTGTKIRGLQKKEIVAYYLSLPNAI